MMRVVTAILGLLGFLAVFAMVGFFGWVILTLLFAGPAR